MSLERDQAIDAFNRGVLLAAAGDPDGAVRAYQQAVRSADADLAPKAVFNIAVLRSNDLTAAASAYRAAVDSGHEDVAPKAAFNLGCLLERHGDIAGAKEIWRTAIESGHEDVVPKAALKLEHLIRSERRTKSRRPRRRTRGHGRAWPALSKRRSRMRGSPGHP